MTSSCEKRRITWASQTAQYLLTWFTVRVSGALMPNACQTCQRPAMMTSSNGNIFRVTGPLCGEFTGHRWIPRTKEWRGALMFSLICAWIKDWVNNREAGDLIRHRAHYDVTVMGTPKYHWLCIVLWPCPSQFFRHYLSACRFDWLYDGPSNICHLTVLQIHQAIISFLTIKVKFDRIP